jgi:hypothetical protein
MAGLFGSSGSENLELELCELLKPTQDLPNSAKRLHFLLMGRLIQKRYWPVRLHSWPRREAKQDNQAYFLIPRKASCQTILSSTLSPWLLHWPGEWSLVIPVCHNGQGQEFQQIKELGCFVIFLCREKSADRKHNFWTRFRTFKRWWSC